MRGRLGDLLGGTTLDRLLAAAGDRAPGRRAGRDLLDALDREEAARPVRAPSEGPARHFLRAESYPRAVCWVAACLADALHHAHGRGLVHLDVKPSNVLLAADGMPMLLDFHLARPPLRPDDPPPDWLGGTPAYMAPEQHAAMAVSCRVPTGQCARRAVSRANTCAGPSA